MYKKKIRLLTPDSIAEFVKICCKYSCDINIYDGRSVIDAKSIVGVFTISQGKEVEVEVNSVDENDVVGSLNDMKRFEVK